MRRICLFREKRLRGMVLKWAQKGFNQAVAAFKAGAKVTLATKLGTDSFSDIALNTMEKLGMETGRVFRPNGRIRAVR